MTTIKVRCPECSAGLRVPEQYLGKTGRCPRCQANVAISVENEEFEDFELLPEGAADGAPAPSAPAAQGAKPAGPPPADSAALSSALDAINKPITPEKKKKKKKKKSSGGLFSFLPSVSIDPGLVKIGVAVVSVIAFGFCGFCVVRSVFRVRPTEIADTAWQPFEGSGFRAQFPGVPKRQAQSAMGVSMVMHMFQPSRDSVFGVGYTEGELAPHRKAMTTEELLNDSCDGSAANLTQMGAREVGRTSIQLGPYPGKELVMYIPQASGNMVGRCYLVNGKLYILMCGGTGFEPGGKYVKKFFDSFQIIEADTPAKPSASDLTPSFGQLALAFHSYHDELGQFPADIKSKDGQPVLSWRVAVLPYIDQRELYAQFRRDEPWDSPHNQSLLEKMPAIFGGGGGDKFATAVQVVTGERALYSGKSTPKLNAVLDGTRNTIMLVESGEPVPWTKPQDVVYDPNGPLPKLGGPDRESFAAGLCDGSVKSFAKNTPEATLRAWLTASGGERLP